MAETPNDHKEPKFRHMDKLSVSKDQNFSLMHHKCGTRLKKAICVSSYFLFPYLLNKSHRDLQQRSNLQGDNMAIMKQPATIKISRKSKWRMNEYINKIRYL